MRPRNIWLIQGGKSTAKYEECVITGFLKRATYISAWWFYLALLLRGQHLSFFSMGGVECKNCQMVMLSRKMADKFIHTEIETKILHTQRNWSVASLRYTHKYIHTQTQQFYNVYFSILYLRMLLIFIYKTLTYLSQINISRYSYKKTQFWHCIYAFIS